MADKFCPSASKFFFMKFAIAFFCFTIYEATAASRSLGGPIVIPTPTILPQSTYPTIKPEALFRLSTPSWRKIVRKEDAKVDLIFMIDGSGSVNQFSRNDFNLMKTWVVNVSAGFNISNGNVRTGVVQYSHWQRHVALKDQQYIRTEIPLGGCNTPACFKERMDAVNLLGYTSYIGAAINKTVKFDFAASGRDTNKILIVITDGQSDDDVTYASSFARSQNVTIFAVGVRYSSLAELQILANGEVHNNLRVYQVGDFSQLDETVSDLQSEIKGEYQVPGCNPLVTPQQGKVKCTNGNEVGSACTLSCDKNKGLTIQGNETRRCLYDHRNGVAHWNGEPFTCGVCRGRFDLLVVLDISSEIQLFSFNIIKDFLIRILDTFHIGPDAVQVSFIHHDSRVVRNWDYNSFTDRYLLLREFLNLPHANEETKTAVPLSLTLSRSLFSGVGKRSTTPHVIFVVTDGTSIQYLAEHAQQLQLVSKVVAVGIGQADPALVSHIASPPSDQFSFTYTEPVWGLLSTIRQATEKICHAQQTALRTFCPWEDLPNSENCSISVSCSNSNRVGSVCRASCCLGYEIVSNPTTTCNYNGNWSQTTWRCMEKTCSNIPLSEGLKNRCTDECNVNSTCVISCDEGYVISAQSDTNCRFSTVTQQVECSTTCQRRSGEDSPMWREEINFTCLEINECLSNPCENNGSCLDLINGFNCTCLPGFVGTMCERNVDECASSPCRNNATCVDDVNAYVCHCVEGFSGKDCSTNIDDCASNPCENNGNCSDGINDFLCQCEAGFEGKRCEIELDWCADAICANGGSCINHRENYTCKCVEGFEGIHCQLNINDSRNESRIHVTRCSPDPLRSETRPRSICNGTEEIGTVCTLRCLNGSRPKTFSTNKPRRRICLDTGRWSIDDDEWGCDEIMQCPSLMNNIPIGRHMLSNGGAPFIVNSTDDDVTMHSKHVGQTRSQNPYEVASVNCTDEDMVGSICHLSCRQGYRLSGSNRSICLSNGRWAPPTSSECVRTQCPSLEYPNVTCTNGNFPESVCNRTCPTGYKLFGPSSKSCSTSFTWEPANPWLCLAECSTPPPSTNNAMYQCTASHFNGSVCSAKCLPGYRERMKTQYTCYVNAADYSTSWRGQEGSCEPVNCQRSIDLTDGRVNGFTPEDEIRLVSEPQITVDQQFDQTTDQQPNHRSYKAIVGLQTLRNSSVTINLWYGDSPMGRHIRIGSNVNGSDDFITGLDDRLLFHDAPGNSSHNSTDTAYPNIFHPYDHVTVRIERNSFQLRTTRTNDVIRHPLSHRNISLIYFNHDSFSSISAPFSNDLSIASGLHFVCIDTNL